MDTRAELRSVCDKLAEDMVKPFLVQKEHIYIDSDLLYDYRLGAVLALTRSEEDFNHVVEHINDYLNAPTLECAKFFPNLGLTEKDLDEALDDPQNFVFLNAASPATLFVNDLESIIRIFNTINQSRETLRPIHITINQRRIKMHILHQRALTEKIHAVDPSVIVEFTEYKSWFEVPANLIECQDFICVYDMVEFLQEGTVSQKLLAAVPPKLSKCNIVTLLQSNVPNPTVEHFNNLRVMLEVMCNKFTFRPKTLLSKELING